MVDSKKLHAFVAKNSKKKPAEAEEAPEKPEHDDAKIAKFVREEGDKINAGKGDRKLIEFIRKNYDPDNNPGSWVLDEDKWERAKEAVDPEGEGGDKYDEPYAVVAATYKRMGGRIKAAKPAKGKR
jgi:hypothetical protein